MVFPGELQFYHTAFFFSVAYFGIFATFEERSHTNEADIIVPHDRVLGIIPGDFEDVLKDCTVRVNKERLRCKLVE